MKELIKQLQKDDEILYCSQVEGICCRSCHEDEEELGGLYNLYNEATEDVPIAHHLCCIKYETVRSGVKK